MVYSSVVIARHWQVRRSVIGTVRDEAYQDTSADVDTAGCADRDPLWRGHRVADPRIFGLEKRPSYVDGQVDDAMPNHPKQLVYEVFGPAGAVADINYFDANTLPQQVNGARLPWSLQITSNSPAVVGSIVAQGGSDSIGCRIVVDGEVKAERISNEVNAFTHCLVKGA